MFSPCLFDGVTVKNTYKHGANRKLCTPIQGVAVVMRTTSWWDLIKPNERVLHRSAFGTSLLRVFAS